MKTIAQSSLNKHSRGWLLAIVCAVLPMLAVAQTPQASQAAQQGPGELIDVVVRQVLKELDAHRAEMKGDPKKIRKLVDDLMLPYFDTEFAARQVLGQHWRTATPEQRKRFIAAFYQSILQNYGEALLDFTPDRLKVFPYKEVAPNVTQAEVRTEVRRDNGSRVPVTFKFRKTEAGWKAWDVVIEGISYVISFKTDFSNEIAQKGLDGVITRLETQQASDKPIKSDSAKKK